MGLLIRAVKSLAKTPPPEPWDEVETLEEKIDALVRVYAADLLADDAAPPADGMWIFRQRPDRHVTVRAIVLLAEDAAAQARAETATLGAQDWSCVCRCRTHQRTACPLCVAVEGCPAHSEPDPEEVAP